MTEYKTEDEQAGMGAGKIPPSGIIFRMCFLKEREGQYVDERTGKAKPYWIAESWLMDDECESGEKQFFLSFSSIKLQKVLVKALNEFDSKRTGKGVWLRIKGRGEQKSRNYDVLSAGTYEDLMLEILKKDGKITNGE